MKQNLQILFPFSIHSYCRPLRIAFEKETTDSIKTEYKRVKEEIHKLNLTKIRIEEKECSVEHKLYLTMLDGKSVNAIENNSASSVIYTFKYLYTQIIYLIILLCFPYTQFFLYFSKFE